MKAKNDRESAASTENPSLASLRALLDTPNGNSGQLWRALSQAPDSELLALGTAALPALAEVLLAPLPATTASFPEATVRVLGLAPETGREVRVLRAPQSAAITDGHHTYIYSSMTSNGVTTFYGPSPDTLTLAEAVPLLAQVAAAHAGKAEKRRTAVAKLDARAADDSSVAWKCALAIQEIIAGGSGDLDAMEQAALDRLGVSALQLGSSTAHAATFARFLRRLSGDERARLLTEALSVASKPQRFFAHASLVPRGSRPEFTRRMFERFDTLDFEEGFTPGLQAIGPELAAKVASTFSLPLSAMTRIEHAFTGPALQTFQANLERPRLTWCEELAVYTKDDGGPTSTVVLLDIDENLQGATSRRGGDSWSVVGGQAPGVDIPVGPDGAAMTHIVTIDLQEVPGLRRQFADARAISFFAPDPDAGLNYEDSRIVAVPASAAPPVGGRALHLFDVKVPAAVFRSWGKRSESAHAAARVMWQRAGWIGPPLWVQDAADPDAVLMQLLDRIGVNTGGGALYVEDSGRAFMQCS